MDNRVNSNTFDWFASKFPGTKPSKGPTPMLWLSRRGQELYLVNSSGESIDEVSATNGGMQTIDDAAVSVDSKSQYTYKNVEPNQAVKVDEYDDFYDLDLLIQVTLTIRSSQFGHMEIRSPLSKGGLKRNTALIWSTGKFGKNVQADIIR